jgi:hypothetical protein
VTVALISAGGPQRRKGFRFRVAASHDCRQQQRRGGRHLPHRPCDSISSRARMLRLPSGTRRSTPLRRRLSCGGPAHEPHRDRHTYRQHQPNGAHAVSRVAATASRHHWTKAPSTAVVARVGMLR